MYYPRLRFIRASWLSDFHSPVQQTCDVVPQDIHHGDGWCGSDMLATGQALSPQQPPSPAVDRRAVASRQHGKHLRGDGTSVFPPVTRVVVVG